MVANISHLQKECYLEQRQNFGAEAKLWSGDKTLEWGQNFGAETKLAPLPFVSLI